MQQDQVGASEPQDADSTIEPPPGAGAAFETVVQGMLELSRRQQSQPTWNGILEYAFQVSKANGEIEPGVTRRQWAEQWVPGNWSSGGHFDLDSSR